MNVYGARIRESRIPLLCSSGSLRRSVGESPYLVVQRYTHTHRHAYTSPSSTRISCRANGGRPFVTAEGVYRRQDDPASDTHSLRRIVGRTCSTRACVPEAREPRVCARTYPSPSSPTLPPAPARATYSRIYEYQRGPSSAYTLIYPRTHSRFQLLLSLSLSLFLPSSLRYTPPSGWSTTSVSCILGGITRTQADAPRQPFSERSVRVPRGDTQVSSVACG